VYEVAGVEERDRERESCLPREFDSLVFFFFVKNVAKYFVVFGSLFT